LYLKMMYFRITIMKTITVRLNDELDSELNDIAKSSGTTKSEVVRNVLQKHLLIKKIDEAREILIPYAEKAGYFTDEDIFNDPDLS